MKGGENKMNKIRWLINDESESSIHKTKKDAVNQALSDYIKRKKQLSIFDNFGAIDFDESYDYKKARNRWDLF